MPYKIQPKGNQFCVVKSDDGKQIACHPDKPAAVKQMKALYASEKADLAHAGAAIPCYEEACERAFLSVDRMVEHAEAVHTFSDVERLVSEAVREKYGRRGDYRAQPPIPSIYCWTNDIASDWVVFTVEAGAGQVSETLYKASYTITDNAVTLGDPVEVKRRTVYEPVKQQTEASDA